MSATDNLAPASLEWAAAHIAKFGDTDIFPVPFEFEAIRHSWSAIKSQLTSINLAEYRTRPSRQVLVPKSRTGYRAALQLDPLDALVYASLMHEAAADVEKYRVPAKLKIACSFRLQVVADGSLFEHQGGWPAYHERSVELAQSGRFTHVLLADIADFYNQISHHRVRNALQAAGVAAGRSKNVEGFLSKLTALQSRGLPVGPSASVVLAEASLDDVDKFLMSRGIQYTRYVDDFRIFCDSERAGIEAAHGLTEYLYTAHRLVLTPAKTKLHSVERFVKKELLDPAEEEERGKVARLTSAIEEILENTGYHIDFEDLPDSDLNKLTRDNLKDLFEKTLEAGPLHLGLTRYLLRRAKQLRTHALRKAALDNLAKLAPAMREVIDYLIATTKPRNAAAVGEALLDHLEGSPVGTLPFVRLWGLEFFIKRPVPRLYRRAIRIAESCQNSLGVRPVALLARAHKQAEWVRAQKEKWSNHGPWDLRAIVWAGSILPADERNHWCRLVKEVSGDPLDRAVATLAARG